MWLNLDFRKMYWIMAYFYVNIRIILLYLSNPKPQFNSSVNLIDFVHLNEERKNALVN